MLDFRVTILLQALNNRKNPEINLTDEQWNACFQFAAEHGLQCVFFEYYQPFFDLEFKASKVYKEWQMHIVHRLFWTKKSENQGLQMLNKLKAEKIFAVVLKGIDLASYYAKPECRLMSDMDILIDPKDIEQVDLAFKALDYTHAKEEDTDKERIYYPQTEGYFFEVHHALFKKKMSNFTDEFSQIALKTAVYSEKIQFNVLEPTVSVAYMVIHMAKHLYGTGIGLKALYDLSVYLKAQKNKVNKEKLKDYLNGFHMLRTGSYILACADRYLHCEFNVDYPIDEKILGDLFGIINRSGDTGMREEYIIEQRYENLIQTKPYRNKQKVHRLSFVFLPLEQMRRRYSILNMFPWFLPFFWGIRIIRVIFKSRQNFIKWIHHDIDHSNIIVHKETLSFLKEE